MKRQNIVIIATCIVIVGLCILYLSKHSAEGFENPLHERRVCIVGLAKNIADNLPTTLQKMREIRQLFHPDSAIIVAENDSTDGTKDILKSSGAEVLTFDGKVTMPHRTERLAYLRNELLNHVHEKYPTHDYLINVDMDGIVDNYDASNLRSVLQKWNARQWDALFCNTHPYYDIWALRSKDMGITYDCWDAIHHGGGFETHVRPFSKILSVDLPPIQVESAFNGFGIYRLSSTKGCTYNGRISKCSIAGSTDISNCKQEVCEHVAFHENMRQKGHDKLYICPDLLMSRPKDQQW